MPFEDELRLLTATSAYAAEVHKKQYRQGPSKEPYINHCLRVATLLSEAGITDVWLLQVGLLHDTVEDQGVTPEELKQRFGEQVSSGVLWLTSPSGMKMVDRKAHQAKVVLEMPKLLRLIKLSDQTDNLRSLVRENPGWKASRILRYAEGAQAIAEGCRGINAHLDLQFALAYQAVREMYEPLAQAETAQMTPVAGAPRGRRA